VTSDEPAILGLLHRYCELQDAADVDAVSALFAHAAYRVQGGPSVFGAAAVAALKRAHDKVHDDGTFRTKHVTTNTIVELDPDGRRATTRSYFTVFQATAALPLQCVIAGRYLDAFEKVDDRWRFTDRLIVSDLVGDLSHHIAGDPLGADAAPAGRGAPGGS
jgi:hypothetical protein